MRNLLLMPTWLIVFLCINLPAKAQQPKWLLKWDAAGLTDFVTPVLYYSTEVRTSGKWGFEIGYGTPMYGLTSKKENQTYWELRGEIRRFQRLQQWGGFLYAVEGFYIPRSYTRRNDVYTNEFGQSYYYDAADIDWNVVGGAAKWGVMFNFGERFSVELFSGLGLRLRTLRYEVTNPSLIDQGSVVAASSNSIFNDDLHEGQKALLHLAFGCKLGIALIQ